MIADISLALSKLTIVYFVRGNVFSLTPDDLFSNFTVFLPLLSPNAMSWSFWLVTLFFQALSMELKETVQLRGYFYSDISKLTTSLLQERSLQTLREHAVVLLKKLTDENRHIRYIISTMTTDRGSSHNNILVQSHNSSSSAEQIIVTHSNPEAMVNIKPLVIIKDGFRYPKNPTNGYVSRWCGDFRGCLACGSDIYRFASCSSRNHPKNKSLFSQELWAHVPTTRNRKSEPIHQSFLDADPACSFNVDTTTNFIQTNPAHNLRKITDVDHTTQPDNN